MNLLKIVKESKSFREVGRKIGASNQTAKKKILEQDINTSHFLHGRVGEQSIGKKYGMLTILNTFKKGRRLFALCFCDCGNKKELRLDSLKSNKYFSCGCDSKNRWNMTASKNPAFRGVGEIRKTYFSEIKWGAKKRGLSFEIDMEYLWKLYNSQNKKCILTGEPILFGRIHQRAERTASLDRIDNSKGYIKGNVRWVLKSINMMRSRLDTAYFIELCNLVAKKHPI